MAKREWVLTSVFGGTTKGWFKGQDQFGKDQWTVDQSAALVFSTKKAAQAALRSHRKHFMSGSLIITERV